MTLLICFSFCYFYLHQSRKAFSIAVDKIEITNIELKNSILPFINIGIKLFNNNFQETNTSLF